MTEQDFFPKSFPTLLCIIHGVGTGKPYSVVLIDFCVLSTG